MRGMAYLEGDNLVAFYYISASELWLDEKGAFGGSDLIRKGLLYHNFSHIPISKGHSFNISGDYTV